jgi:hypothetical protein
MISYKIILFSLLLLYNEASHDSDPPVAIDGRAQREAVGLDEVDGLGAEHVFWALSRDGKPAGH